MSIYKLRVLAEGEQEIFRDIEIKSTQNFEDLHEMIVASFGFDGSQMASFYVSDESWNKGQEITLFDVGAEEEGMEKVLVMENVKINNITNCLGDHLLYAYDFLNIHHFFIELIEIKVKAEADFYPRVVYSQGELEIKVNDDEAYSDAYLNDDILNENGADDSLFKDDMFEEFDDLENNEGYDDNENYY